MKVSYMTIAFLLFLLLCYSNVSDSSKRRDKDLIEITEENSEIMPSKEEIMKTEIATVQDIRDDSIILKNNAGDIYCIPHASQFELSMEKDQRLVFSYTEKILSEEGYYVLTVKWLDDWSHFNQNNFIHGE